MDTVGNSEINDIYPETGITEATRAKMFAFIDEMFTPNHIPKRSKVGHIYHLIGELEALRDDLKRMEDARATFLDLAITELNAIII